MLPARFGRSEEWGSGGYLHAGRWQTRVWRIDDGCVALGWILPPEMIRVAGDRWEMGDTALLCQVHPQHPHLLDELLGWFDSSAGPGTTWTTATRAANRDAIERLGRFGYVQDPRAVWSQLNARRLEDLENPRPPAGFVLKTARQVEAARVLGVHRAAWAPSQFTAEGLDAVRATWPYRDDLAVFLEAPDGTLAASALAWYDEANRTSSSSPSERTRITADEASVAPSACSR
ncbi:MAG TPA: hypothetical protein VK217_04405 [Acidimicrobiales bacterium]|nr:hypothetical protein [Acidimicrobiales bacterium]